MNIKPQITCIIPFHNESQRLCNVLDEVVKTNNINQIICVDDASREDNSREIVERYPNIELIRTCKNLGKSGAIQRGLKRARGNFILLLDADLRNLDHKEIEKAIDSIAQIEDLDMLILRRVKANIFLRLIRSDTLYSGERIIKKTYLEEILNNEVEGWQLEYAINNYMYKQGKKVQWAAHSGINTNKLSKWGIIHGLISEMRMYKEILTEAGFLNLLRHILFFAKDKMEVI